MSGYHFMKRIKKMKKTIKTYLLINLFFLFYAFFIAIFLELPSLSGVVVLVVTIIISSFLDGKKGMMTGFINAFLTGGMMVLYFYVIEKPIEFHQFFSTFPLFLIGGYFAGRYNEQKTNFTKKTEKAREKLEKKVGERTKELKEEKDTLEVKIKARTKEIEEEKLSLKKKVEEKTKKLQEKNIELELEKKKFQERNKKLEKFQELTIGRELRMIELKKEIERLKGGK